MDEAMDTLESVNASNEDQNYNEEGVIGQSSSMETSPILDRRAMRSRRICLNAAPRRLNTSAVEASSSNFQELNANAGPHNQQHNVIDQRFHSNAVSAITQLSTSEEAASSSTLGMMIDSVESPDVVVQPPHPMEDTVLIMIRQPVSPGFPANDPDEPQEVVITTAEETNDQNFDIFNETINPRPETPPGENSSDSVPLEQDGDTVGEIPQDDDDVDDIFFVPEPSSSAAPDVENLPLAQRIRSPDLLPHARSPPPKKVKIELEEQSKHNNIEEEEGKNCPICFDSWTNSGEHRLVSLRCGHLFGKHCIEHWLQIHKASDRKCPQCKKKATAKDIRPLYALKVCVEDNSELEALKETIKNLEEEKERLSRELVYEKQLHQNTLKIQHERELQLQELQSKGIFGQSVQGLPATSKQVAAIAAQIKISQTIRTEISRDGGCRVLAFNDWKGVLVASQSQVTPLFPDFGIRLIDTEEFRLRQIIPMHAKAIRDLSFNPHRKDSLLSVSLDKTAKVFCMSSNASVMTVNSEVPLWSCCWDGNNSNIFFAGSHNGITLQYDTRNTHTEVSRITTSGDGAPVVSLAAVPAGSWLPCGGFLSCRLNRLRVYERTSNSAFRENPLCVEGPFSALNYNQKSQHMLVSTKPTMQNPHIQNHLYEMTSVASHPQANIVHSFVGGTTQRVLSRPCQVEIDGGVKDTLICAYQESEGHVAVWSVTSGQKIPAGPLHCADPIMDLCPIKVNDRTFLAALSEKSLRVYQFST